MDVNYFQTIIVKQIANIVLIQIIIKIAYIAYSVNLGILNSKDNAMTYQIVQILIFQHSSVENNKSAILQLILFNNYNVKPVLIIN